MVAELVIDGVRVHVEGEGADTIIMIHGWPDDRRLWDAQVEALSPQYRCVRFSFANHADGRSGANRSIEDVVSLFERTVLKVSPGRPVMLMLHGWGCVYGYQLAMRHPELIARIIGVGVGGSSQESFKASLNWKGRLKLAFYQARLSLAQKKLVEARTVSSTLNFPYVAKWFNGSQRKGALPFKLRCPMLYIYGKRQPFNFHSKAFEATIQTSPGSRVIAFRAGHWVMREQPEAFNNAVLGWLHTTPQHQGRAAG
jgi:pimeloyl-ACP methyl ester carboxylesterase